MSHHKEPPPPPQISTTGNLLWFALTSTTIKLLLIPSYHSTDFEVHRNWLAITHSLPLPRWYIDETSPWTLDYPPFFAYFEYFLSHFAAYVDPTIVHLIRGIDYKAPLCILFQRISVILSDSVLIYAVYRLTKKPNYSNNYDNFTVRVLIWVMIVWSPMLMIVDHVHFQYNGLLLGLLLLSLSGLEQGKDLFGGFVFAVLICFKHLFAVAAPVYFVYLFRHYCRGGLVKGFGRLVMMGSVVVAVFAAAYGPFVYYGQIQQVFRRMFPFGRGLCHAFWAPNFWVFYIILDKLIAFCLNRLGFNIQAPAASFTGGLVGDSSPFAVLPAITPLITFIIVLLAISPCLLKAWKNPQPRMITRWVAYAYTCGFLFGWHVHEKASLHFVIPLAVVAMQSTEDAKHYFYQLVMLPLLSEFESYCFHLTHADIHLIAIPIYNCLFCFHSSTEIEAKSVSVSCYSLFPLLYEAQEYPIKVLLLLLHIGLLWCGFSSYFSTTAAAKSNTVPRGGDGNLETSGAAKTRGFVIGWFGKLYLSGILLVEVYGQVLHPIVFAKKLPF